jgi:hypothetical protein
MCHNEEDRVLSGGGVAIIIIIIIYHYSFKGRKNEDLSFPPLPINWIGHVQSRLDLENL